MSAPISPRNNQLLGRLPPSAQESLFPRLKAVHLSSGATLAESGQAPEYVYFPVDCIVSVINVMQDGFSAETALVGNEGMVGVSVVLADGSSVNMALAQSSGMAFRLPAAEMIRQFNESAETRQVVLNYTLTLIRHTAQVAACNRHHSIDQQLCRWLLLCLDRLSTDTMHVTQELIANLLGVRREGITEAAGKLRRAGAITYQRGKLTVLDRSAIEEMACECYCALAENHH